MEEKQVKDVPKGRWPKYFASFTHGNRGRLIRVSRFEGEKENVTLEEQLPLLAVSYDDHHDGLLSISAGEDRIEYEHPVPKPRHVWVDEDEDGWTKSMIIMDAEGTRTVVSFEE
jgi:hypothetical protein